MRNWAGNQTLLPRGGKLLQPSNEEEVVELVRAAAKNARRLHMIGSGHSWSSVAAAAPGDGDLVSLDCMRKLLEIDADALLVTVEAGIKLHELISGLSDKGFRLPITGSVTAQSIAGAMSTGTHGSSMIHGNLATLAQRIRIVDGLGGVRDICAQDPLFPAVSVSAGCLGIITQVTLRIVPAFGLVEESFAVPWNDLLEQAAELASSAEFVKFWWIPGSEKVQVYRYSKTDDQEAVKRGARTRGLERWIDTNIFHAAVLPVLTRLSLVIPAWLPVLNKAIDTLVLADGRKTGPPELMLTTPMPLAHREAEYALHVDQTAEAMRRLRHIIESAQLRVDLIAEVRFVAADNNLLSPAFGRPSVHVGAYTIYEPDADVYFSAFEEAMLELGGRPHLGKEATLGFARLRDLLPRDNIERFLAAAHELDPQGLFTNSWSALALGLGRPSAATLARL